MSKVATLTQAKAIYSLPYLYMCMASLWVTVTIFSRFSGTKQQDLYHGVQCLFFPLSLTERMNRNADIITTLVYKHYNLACGKQTMCVKSYQNPEENTAMWLIAKQPKFRVMFPNLSAITSYMVGRLFSLSLFTLPLSVYVVSCRCY